MAIDVELVATDEDLSREIGGEALLAELLPDDWSGVGTRARQAALDDVLRALVRRTPPIHEADVQTPAELKMAVVYGALERLYAYAMHKDLDAFGSRRRVYERRYAAEVTGLAPTLVDGERGSLFSIAFSRR